MPSLKVLKTHNLYIIEWIVTSTGACSGNTDVWLETWKATQFVQSHNNINSYT